MITEKGIVTYTGKVFYPLNPSKDVVNIRDIAHALSMTCRFTGHTMFHYSVATHSLICARLAFDDNQPIDICLQALLHDASEAYICDIPAPLKPHLPDYLRAEKQVQDCIMEAFGLSKDLSAIKPYDQEALLSEVRQVMADVNLFPSLAATPVERPVTIKPVTPEESEDCFLEMYNQLISLRGLQYAAPEACPEI